MPFTVFIHGRWGYEGKDDGTASGSYALHTRTRGIWKVMHIHLYNFSQWSEKKDEGINVNVRIWGFWGAMF